MKSKTTNIFLLIIFIWIISCTKNRVINTHIDSQYFKPENLIKTSTPILGYRFVITGDFNGDKVQDTLLERFTDSLSQKEMPKYYENPDSNFDYGNVLQMNDYLQTNSFLEWKSKNVRLSGGHLGFHYIENCGDLNLDGSDEILLVNQWGDYSNLNTAFIYTFQENEWEEIYKFPVWEWQFPYTPSVSMIPGMFGNFDLGVSKSDSLDLVLETELKTFKFIQHYEDNSIEFSGMNPFSLSESDESYLEKYGDQAYINKYFKKVYIQDSLYINEIKNPSKNYKVIEAKTDSNTTVLVFDISDLANMVTTRIFLNHPNSPFKKNK